MVPRVEMKHPEVLGQTFHGYLIIDATVYGEKNRYGTSYCSVVPL
jgi:hypothetical protein